MQNILALISSILISLIGGSVDISSTSNTTNSTSNTAATDAITRMCYNPEVDVTITVNWNQNFQNVSDLRSKLNPYLFSSRPPIFNTDPFCKQIALHNFDTRTYLRVRRDVRISSCKTDEMAGIYNITGKNCVRAQSGYWASADVRGACTVSGYTDLRKVADYTDEAGQLLEIFWVPLSYNVGCNYEPNKNCGPGPSSSRSNFNLKDFIYVLKKRDAFDPNDFSVNCDPLWDAGSVNEGACSHYFDVYMAKDIWEELQAGPLPDGHPDKNVDDFFRQAVLNCRENNYFSPIEGSGSAALVGQEQTLKLGDIEMRAHNEWTWATPWCKPAIYLYPTKETNINVKLTLDGKVTESSPLYDPNYGWNVTASPEGSLRLYSGQVYPYLYYEADIRGVKIPKEGWLFERSKIEDQISKMMETIGFNNKEIADFLTYWLPRLTEKPYYFVTLLPENTINEKEKITFSQNPDTLIRTRFVFEGLDAPFSVKPLQFTSYKRTGFTVTDWGGTLVGKDCRDIMVK